MHNGQWVMTAFFLFSYEMRRISLRVAYDEVLCSLRRVIYAMM